ncbi:MAG: NAD-dependent epimerase/dehydratase family protein [Bradymonadia bacterium]
MKVLITGASGYLARIVAQQLSATGHQVVGIDHRPWFDCPPEIRLEKLDIRKRPTADLFRQFRPQVVIHMATETYVSATTEERYRLNLNGTQSIWSYCEKFNVKQAIFVGRHTVYGAAADAPLYRKETEPLLAGTTFPTLADLVSADLYAGQALWRTPKLKTAVLRVAYPLGPMGRGTLANYLGGPRVPMVLGFDPLFQCIHTEDAASAVIAAMDAKIAGIYNIAGPPPIPLSALVKGVSRRAIPIPEPLLPYTLGRFGLSRLPRASLSHLKYPIVIDDSAFKVETGFKYTYQVEQIMGAFRETRY